MREMWKSEFGFKCIWDYMIVGIATNGTMSVRVSSNIEFLTDCYDSMNEFCHKIIVFKMEKKVFSQTAKNNERLFHFYLPDLLSTTCHLNLTSEEKEFYKRAYRQYKNDMQGLRELELPPEEFWDSERDIDRYWEIQAHLLSLRKKS